MRAERRLFAVYTTKRIQKERVKRTQTLINVVGNRNRLRGISLVIFYSPAVINSFWQVSVAGGGRRGRARARLCTDVIT